MLGNRLYDDGICDMSGKITRRRQIKMDRFDQYSYYTLLARARVCVSVCLSYLHRSREEHFIVCLLLQKKGAREKSGDGGTRAQSKQQSTSHFEEREEGSVES